MSTTREQPPAAPTAAETHPWKELVVCAQLFAITGDTHGLVLETFGACCLAELLELQLRHHGIEIGTDKPLVRSTGTLHRAIYIVTVRDVAGAAHALRPLLERLHGRAFFVVGYIDRRENYHRTLWPEKPAFDLHQHMAELLPETLKANGRIKTALKLWTAEIKAAFAAPDTSAPDTSAPETPPA